MHTDSNTEFQNLISVITSNVSSNRIKIQEILSILQLETDYFSKLLRYRSRCQDDIFPRIELIPSFVLSSDNTNCKNDIQLFHQLFDELSVHTDYH